MSRGNHKAFIKEGQFQCKCGRGFTKSQSLYAHQARCQIYLGERYDPSKHKGWNVGESRAWARGRTMHDPVYGESIRKSIESMRAANPKGMLGKHQSEESKRKQSETRKARYASGELTPAHGVGRGKYSYLLYGDKRILLRSTYEFIYALYLLYQGIDFEYETVRVTYLDHTYISDFLVDDTVIEIKGNYHADTSRPRKAFESAGYKYEVKFWEDISECYEYLKSKVDIDNLLESIRVGHDSREYYEYRYVGI